MPVASEEESWAGTGLQKEVDSKGQQKESELFSSLKQKSGFSRSYGLDVNLSSSIVCLSPFQHWRGVIPKKCVFAGTQGDDFLLKQVHLGKFIFIPEYFPGWAQELIFIECLLWCFSYFDNCMIVFHCSIYFPIDSSDVFAHSSCSTYASSTCKSPRSHWMRCL